MRKTLFLLLTTLLPLTGHGQLVNKLPHETIIKQKCSLYVELSQKIYSSLSSGTPPLQVIKDSINFARTNNIPEQLVYLIINKTMKIIENKTFITIEQFLIFETGYCIGRLETILGQNS